MKKIFLISLLERIFKKTYYSIYDICVNVFKDNRLIDSFLSLSFHVINKIKEKNYFKVANLILINVSKFQNNIFFINKLRIMMGYINYHQKQYNEVLYYLEIEYKKISEYERIIIVCLKLLTNIKLKNYHNIENLILFLIRNTNFKYSSLILEMVLRLLLEEKEVNLFNKTYSQLANCANTNINKIIKNYSKINNNNFNQYDLIEIYNKATTLGLNDAINYSINKLIHFFYFNNVFEEACNWQNKHRLNTPKKLNLLLCKD